VHGSPPPPHSGSPPGHNAANLLAWFGSCHQSNAALLCTALSTELNPSPPLPAHPPPLVQYTIILPASKNLPSQVVDFKKGKTQKRKSVGVRYPDEPISRVRVRSFP